MDRFEFVQFILADDEAHVAKHRSIKIYHGDQKTNYEDGEVVLTTHRLFWGRVGEMERGLKVLSLHHKYVHALDEETASSYVFGRKKRIILRLKDRTPDKMPGPMDHCTDVSHIKLSGRNGIDETFIRSLSETIMARVWEIQVNIGNNNDGAAAETEDTPRHIKLRTGIVGIERNIQERQKQTDENINLAFQDLSKLMTMAKQMVAISKAISTKICERNGEISEDETVKFKAYLMSLGIDDPVTRDNAISNSEYYQLLANQICQMMLDPITENGGMMSMADVYCRVNRGRGLELLSPEDLLNACHYLNGPIKLRTFPSGAMVLQLENHDEEAVAEETFREVENAKCLSVEQLARILNISLLLAQERLLTAERAGKVCRDDSIEGLSFYPNRFLQNILIE